MATISKRLAGPASLTTSAATKYTCPASTITTISRMRVSNPSGGALTFTLSIGADAASTRLYDGVSVPAGGAIDTRGPFTLAAGDVIQAFGSGTALVFEINGYEAATSETTFPLQASASGLFQQTAAGAPFLPIGQSAWLLAAQPTYAQQVAYFDNIVANGFNAAYVQIFAKRCDHSNNASAAGHDPFTNVGTLTVNPLYLADLAAMAAAALARGVLLQLSFYYGYAADPADGYYNEFASAGASACRVMSAAVAAALIFYPNVTYQIGGDYPSGDVAIANAIYDGIRDVSSVPLITSYWGSVPGTTSRDISGRAWVTPCGVSSWGDVPALVAGVYGAGTPVSFQEGKYENNNTYGWSRSLLRLNAFNSFLRGALGGLYYGNECVWPFDSTDTPPQAGAPAGHSYTEYLSQPGCLDHAAVGAFLRTFAWHTLVPDVSSALITSGRGSDLTYVGAAKNPAGTLAVAYAPTAATFTVDRSRMASSITARWWNPVALTYTLIGTGISNTGTQNFNAPGNSDGTDSVLVLTCP